MQNQQDSYPATYSPTEDNTLVDGNYPIGGGPPLLKTRSSAMRLISRSSNSLRRTTSQSGVGLNKLKRTITRIVSSNKVPKAEAPETSPLSQPRSRAATVVSTSGDSLATTVMISAPREDVADPKKSINVPKYLTVTSSVFSDISTPLQQQSMVDSMRQAENESLKAYITRLVQQQSEEDYAMELIETRFREGGWCSIQELEGFRSKRYLLNQEWARKIQFQQGEMTEDD